MRQVYFITHPEVIVDANVPVPQWSLSERGLERMHLLLNQPWIDGITSIYCSTEKKAIDGASILAGHLSLNIQQLTELGENDRSATGFLPPAEFEMMADKFFAEPQNSIRGWETANVAQQRIIKAVNKVCSKDGSKGSIAIVSHGAVGALMLCHLAGYQIARKHDQPGDGGGNYYRFELESMRLTQEWKPIDSVE